MKSVVQEASSLSKAFEQAWHKAGKPTQCTVKVLEEAEHNFIGMTKRSAKIALFFEGDEPVKGQAPRSERPRQQRERAPQQRQQQKAEPVEPRQAEKAPAQPSRPEQAERPDYWSDEMVSAARTWFKGVLGAMERSDIGFDVNVNRFYLRLSVDKSVYEDESRERELFRNLSFLLLQTLRNKFNRPLKGYKVVLARKE